MKFGSLVSFMMTWLGKLRTQNGRSKPYDVKLWQIGNEVYGSYQIGHTTAEDYATFLQMLLSGGQLDGTRILTPKTVELMTVDHVGDYPWGEGVGFGLGFYVLEDLGARGQPGSVGEFGWGGAYHSTYWVDPREELVVVYLTQLIPAGGLDDHGKLRALVYQSIVDEQ